MAPSAMPTSEVIPPLTVKSTVEREIKLSIDSDFRLPPLAGTPLPRQLLISTYYDTSHFDLAHVGITLRHRRANGTRSWQLKLPLDDARQEVELCDPSDVPPAAFRELLVLHLGTRRLVPVVTLRVYRTGVRAQIRKVPTAAVTVDSVSVVKNDCVIQRFRELEIEQVGGDDKALEALEHQLRRSGANTHDGRPKLFRALSLAAPSSDDPPMAVAPVLDHLKWALARQVRWLLAHDPGTRLGMEPESLHQMRVATRRLRAMLRAARPLLAAEWADALRSELAWLSQLLGTARDLDVQIAYFHDAAASFEVRDRKPLEQFIAHLAVQRAKLQQVVLSELNSSRYFDLIRRLQHAPEEVTIANSDLSLRDIAAEEFRKVRKIVRRIGSSPKDTALHRLRIKVKRARYAAELAEPSVGKPVTRFLKQAQAAQNLLGQHQDAIQAEHYIRSFLRQSSRVRAGFVAGRLVEQQRARREMVREQLPALYKTLLKRGRKAWS